MTAVVAMNLGATGLQLWWEWRCETQIWRGRRVCIWFWYTSFILRDETTAENKHLSSEAQWLLSLLWPLQPSNLYLSRCSEEKMSCWIGSWQRKNRYCESTDKQQAMETESLSRLNSPPTNSCTLKFLHTIFDTHTEYHSLTKIPLENRLYSGMQNFMEDR